MKIFSLLLSLFLSYNLFCSEFNANITVSADNGKSVFKNTYFGVNYKATNSIDTVLGEFTMPKPFDWVLSASFKVYDADLELTNYTYKDYRPEISGLKDSIVYQLKVSGTNNFKKYTIKWSGLPSDYPNITLRSKFYTASYLDNVNMKAIDSVVVDNTILDEFYIVIKKNSSAVEESVLNNDEVFPNPTSEFINIKDKNIKSYRVVGMLGKDVSELTQLNSGVLNVANLTPATYYMIINMDNGIAKKYLFIKK
jgi:hypothetical protein